MAKLMGISEIGNMKVMARVFLSYARADEAKVEYLYQQLNDLGFTPWMDKKDILPGELFESSIDKAIRRSDFFLVCLSTKSANKRGFLQREIKTALDIWQEKLESDIYLIPVRLEDCEVPDSLRNFQWANLFEEEGWLSLVKAIQVGIECRVDVIRPIIQEPPVLEKPQPMPTTLAKALSHKDVEVLFSVRKMMLDLLANDRLDNGGWGKRNNKALRTFFGELPDDFDTEGSITLTRWVVDAIARSHLNPDSKSLYLDERLNAYLDARFDREVGASGRISSSDLLGHRPIHTAPRHTAASILCYLGFDSNRFLHCAKLQLKHLADSYRGCFQLSKEVGHPDILRSLYLAQFHLTTDDIIAKEIVEILIKEGFPYFWDWLNSPTLILNAFGQSAQLYLRLYSLCSVCDLTVMPGFETSLLPLHSFQRILRREVEEFCKVNTAKDHRNWGFPTLLLWSYLCCPSEELGTGDLRNILSSIIDEGGDFQDGFCVYWAVLFAITDSLIKTANSDA